MKNQILKPFCWIIDEQMKMINRLFVEIARLKKLIEPEEKPTAEEG